MPILGTCEPVVVVGAISALLTALGLSAASGLRAYLPVLAVVVGTTIPNGCSQGGDLITLSTPFKQLIGNDTPWALVAVLAVLAGGEFVVDKVPIVDHASDLVHTVIRPVAGAVVMSGISNPVSEWNPWVAAVAGAALALTVHGAKAATRPAVTATTAGLGNPVVSLGEDLLAGVLSVLALLAPFLAILFLVLLVLLFVRAASSTLHWAFGRRGGPAPAGPVQATGPLPRNMTGGFPQGAEPNGPTWPE